MRAQVERALPEEACGLLVGRGDVVSAVLPVENQDHSPTSFRMDPRQQLEAFSRMEADGLDLIGIYHSHPASPEAGSAPNPGPSPTDIAEAAYPVLHLIWSRPRGQWQARLYAIREGRSLEVELLIERGQ